MYDNTPAIAIAEATSEETINTLPLPLRVCFAITFASRSIWKIKPLKRSTDQRPFESVSKSKKPGVVTPYCAPNLALL